MTAAATSADAAVLGGGVVGCAVAHALARRGVTVTLLEREDALALAASGTNSGILHTGFDSPPGELETELILRATALRERLRPELGYPLLECGARMTPLSDEDRAATERLAANGAANGVAVDLDEDGTLRVPGEAVTDPVAFVHVLAGAAAAGGAEIRLGTRATALAPAAGGGFAIGLAGGGELTAGAVVNCAGLYADEVAALAGERPAEIYPRKGEFLVFAPPGGGPDQILLPVPSAAGKGVLVFPTLDGHTIAGPTARDRADKEDWSVEPDAEQLIRARAERIFPRLRGLPAAGAYAGLRPAGRRSNYVIAASSRLPGLVHAAAVRSTGLSASLAIGEHVAGLLEQAGAVALGPERLLAVPAAPPAAVPWWRRTAESRGLWPGRQAEAVR